MKVKQRYGFPLSFWLNSYFTKQNTTLKKVTMAIKKMFVEFIDYVLIALL